MSTSHETLKLFRKLHLYIGVFISPALLFFAFTGAIQTFSLHETTQGSNYKPPAILVTLGQIHKKQTSIVPVRKPRPDAPKPDATATDHPKHDHDAAPDSKAVAASTVPPVKQKSHLPLKIFFLLVAIGLLTSTVTGLYMTYKYARNKWTVTALLIAGVVIPPLLLPF
jgi:hypothetical protein